uniref:Uncharacterized protein n=1 Tax=Serinus canaria TaxID=9135 RepID=A0A8C9NNJ9_SERCA
IKGNFRSVIAMSKTLTGVKIPTERIVTNGKERIETADSKQNLTAVNMVSGKSRLLFSSLILYSSIPFVA